ncbi:nascent polypeptide-associated complex subunit alpha, muscle-specific form [Helicoverpa armigera]|uniref:nascent polypeptide-associated complex subunit alpha, muscle-specific form n=1 Tax=Helicoverpa armigera TaxID=29058 RepID=UPI003082F7A7
MAFGRVVNSALKSTLLCSARKLRVFYGQDDRGSAAWSTRALVSTLLGSRTARLLRERRSRISRLVHPGTRVYSARLANCAPSPGKAIEDQPPGLPGQSCLLCSAREKRASSGQGDRGSAAWSTRALVSTLLGSRTARLLRARRSRISRLVFPGSRVYSAKLISIGSTSVTRCWFTSLLPGLNSGASLRAGSPSKPDCLLLPHTTARPVRLSALGRHEGVAIPPLSSRPPVSPHRLDGAACPPVSPHRLDGAASPPVSYGPARRRGLSACLLWSGSTARPVRLSPMVRLDGAACPPVSYGPARRRGLSACLLWSGSTARPVRLSPMVRLDGAACPPVSPHRLDGAACPPVSYGPARRRGQSACLLWSGSTARPVRLSPMVRLDGAASPPVSYGPARRRGLSACLPSPARRRGLSACLPSPARRRGQSACLLWSGSTARPVRLSPSPARRRGQSACLPHRLDGAACPPVSPHRLDGAACPPVSPHRLDGAASPPVSPHRLDGAACPPVSPHRLDGAACPPVSPHRLDGAACPPVSPHRLDGAACPPVSLTGSTARPVRLSLMVRLDGAACPPVSPHRLDGAACPPVSYGPARRRGLSACLLWSGSTARPVRLSPLTGSTARPVRLSPMVRLDGAASPPVSYGPARRRGQPACLLWSGSTARPVRLSPLRRGSTAINLQSRRNGLSHFPSLGMECLILLGLL